MLNKLLDWLKKFFKNRKRETIVSKKVQFILKQRECLYGGEDDCGYSSGLLHSGLYNSARFMCDMLNEQTGGMFEAEIVHVIDNNCIDREVTRFKPDVVVIEAFWVVPEKFEVLTKLHPNVKWIIRNHSKAPFLANEGIAFDWAVRYTQYDNVYISSNAENTNDEIAHLIKNYHENWNLAKAKEKCPYLPNYYPIMKLRRERPDYKAKAKEVHIGCFGAIRPLKNHMLQAIAAVKFADKLGKKLYFHINGGRIEGSGDSVLKNLRQMFSHMEHELVEHNWMPHDKFLEFVGTMDFGLQVSYTETFNIVTADMVSQGVPVIVSDEVDWVSDLFYANPNDSDDIAQKLFIANIYARAQGWVFHNHDNLHKYNQETLRLWIHELQRLTAKS